MSRLNVFTVLSLIILVFSLLLALGFKLIPPNLFTEENFKFYLGLIGSLVVATFTSLLFYYLNKFLDRSVLRIVHVNFKSDRVPFKLDNELWWYIIHTSSLLEFLDKRVEWSLNCFDKNEFRYYQLSDIKINVDIFLGKYKATSIWLEQMFSLIEICRKESACSDDFDKLYPYLSRFENHYHSTFNSGIFNDFKENQKKVIDFIFNESKGMLNAHKKEIEDMEKIIKWTEENLESGENQPKPIDYRNKKVPQIQISTGITNSGRIPGLVKFIGKVYNSDFSIPLKLSGVSYSFFHKIDPNQIKGLDFEVDTNKCGFDDLKLFYEKLISDKKDYTVHINVELVDGSLLKKRKVTLYDDNALL